ncbi:MAG TPA: hypothetical protein ENJ15_01070 [Caldithrix abyssi]|uniref:Zinc-finger domain-containing protein n=1 Tax=Caldithrix abyssi TaxID=187145 RepID=A0A7V5RP41_CALAY|nr:hypothetical protein [Caldithrix abyssi]
MLDCDKAKNLLNDYIEGMLDPQTQKELEQFLEEDPECRALFQEARLIRRHLQNLPAVKAPDNFDMELRQRIMTYIQEGEKPLRGRKGLSVVFSGGILLAAAYMFIFTDIGADESRINNNVIPASTISTTVSSPRLNNKQQADIMEQAAFKDSLEGNRANADPKQINLVGDKH